MISVQSEFPPEQLDPSTIAFIGSCLNKVPFSGVANAELTERRGSVEDVTEAFRRHHLMDDRVHFLQGWFSEVHYTSLLTHAKPRSSESCSFQQAIIRLRQHHRCRDLRVRVFGSVRVLQEDSDDLKDSDDWADWIQIVMHLRKWIAFMCCRGISDAR
jgi:hypothetical protein